MKHKSRRDFLKTVGAGTIKASQISDLPWAGWDMWIFDQLEHGIR